MAAKLSDAEKVYIIHGFEANLRVDGRSCEDYRPIVLECGVISSASGSARVTCGNTDVLVGVKAEIGKPDLESPTDGFLKFFVDCSANATPDFEGRGGEGVAEDLTSALLASTERGFDLKQLGIVPGTFVWTLYVDIVLLEYGGNLYDTASLAVKAALADTSLPNAIVSSNEKNEPELDMPEDPFDTKSLDLSNFPLLVTVNKIGRVNGVDCTLEEECCILTSLVMGVSPSEALLFFRQEGRGSLDPESVQDMLKFGTSLTSKMHTVLTNKLANQSGHPVGFL